MRNKTITLSIEEVDLLVWAMEEAKKRGAEKQEVIDLHKRLLKIQRFMFPRKEENQ